MSNAVTIQTQLTQEVATWIARVNTAGGGFEWNSIGIANQLVRTLRATTYFNKIKYLLPLLGVGINAARVPLIDTIGAGVASNNNFVNSDFNQTTGLHGDGSTKRFDLGFTGAVLGNAGSGALGYWSLIMGTVGDWVIGERNGDLYGIYLNSALQEGFYWGNGGNIDTTDGSTTNGHYYGQRTQTTMRLYKSGTLVSGNGTTSFTGTIGDSNMNLMGIDGAFLSNGACGAAYFTDGTLTDNEISDFNILLRAYLMGPTGRI